MASDYLLAALQTVADPFNFGILVLSDFVGLLMGILPGLSATMAIALLTGITYGLPGASALISLVAVYVGSISGGCQSAILLNIPGTPASAATASDGFPLAKQGKAGMTIFLATTASCIGTLLSVICVLTLTPVLTSISLKFGSWEFFLLAIFGVVICGNLTSKDNAIKGWVCGILGLLVSQVGLDMVSAYPRFSYDNANLMSGLQLIPIMIGLFGFPEIINAFKKTDTKIMGMSPFQHAGRSQNPAAQQDDHAAFCPHRRVRRHHSRRRRGCRGLAVLLVYQVRQQGAGDLWLRQSGRSGGGGNRQQRLYRRRHHPGYVPGRARLSSGGGASGGLYDARLPSRSAADDRDPGVFVSDLRLSGYQRHRHVAPGHGDRPLYREDPGHQETAAHADYLRLMRGGRLCHQQYFV
jgi:hypothetical protein